MGEKAAEAPRSLHSREKCYVRFINTTSREVEIIWITYSGEYLTYNVITPGQYIDINTYKTHPFIAKDCRTKDMLHIAGGYFYHPKTSKEVVSERFPNAPVPDFHEVRVKAFITLPVYSLYYGCLLALRNCLSNEKDVENLELPRNLSEDLKKVIAKRNGTATVLF